MRLLKKSSKGGALSREACVLLLFYLPLISPWNLGLMAGTPVAILDHEVILKIEATHIKGGGMDKKKIVPRSLMTAELPLQPR